MEVWANENIAAMRHNKISGIRIKAKLNDAAYSAVYIYWHLSKYFHNFVISLAQNYIPACKVRRFSRVLKVHHFTANTKTGPAC